MKKSHAKQRGERDMERTAVLGQMKSAGDDPWAESLLERVVPLEVEADGDPQHIDLLTSPERSEPPAAPEH